MSASRIGAIIERLSRVHHERVNSAADIRAFVERAGCPSETEDLAGGITCYVRALWSGISLAQQRLQHVTALEQALQRAVAVPNAPPELSAAQRTLLLNVEAAGDRLASVIAMQERLLTGIRGWVDEASELDRQAERDLTGERLDEWRDYAGKRWMRFYATAIVPALDTGVSLDTLSAKASEHATSTAFHTIATSTVARAGWQRTLDSWKVPDDSILQGLLHALFGDDPARAVASGMAAVLTIGAGIVLLPIALRAFGNATERVVVEPWESRSSRR